MGESRKETLWQTTDVGNNKESHQFSRAKEVVWEPAATAKEVLHVLLWRLRQRPELKHALNRRSRIRC